MNYRLHYDRMISRARGRVLVGYRERHHVVPRCMKGGDEPENLVDLTAEEHYVAHQLLVKIHPTVDGLSLAAFRMAKQCTGNKAFGWLRRKMARDSSKRNLGTKQSPELVAKRIAPLRGRKRSPETCAKMSAAMTGKKHTAETLAKMSASMTGLKRLVSYSVEHRAKIGSALRGRKQSIEVCKQKSLAQRGKTFSPEHRANISSALTGKRKTPEHIMSAALARRGIPVSQEWRDKISNSKRGKPWSVARRAAYDARAQ